LRIDNKKSIIKHKVKKINFKKIDKTPIVIVGQWGFGDHLMSSVLVHILNDYGIPSFFKSKYSHLCNVPTKPKSLKYSRTFKLDYREVGHHNQKIKDPKICPSIAIEPFIYSGIKKLNKEFNLNIPLRRLPYVPVKFQTLDHIPSYDVVLCTKTGPATPLRSWGRFKELKRIMKEEGISYKDITDIHGYECLNYVSNSKVYVGLETGMSHYVSQFARGKGIIIQSQYCRPEWWCPYDYEIIQSDSICKYYPCFVDVDCFCQHKCMKIISPQKVLNSIEKYL